MNGDTTWPPPRTAAAADQDRARATGAPAGWVAPTGPPGRRSLVREALAVRQPLRLVARTRALRRAPRGAGGIVLTIPGYGAGEPSVTPLTAYLGSLGHDARTWGHGRNTGDPERDRDLLLPTITHLAEVRGPVALVGWSLGGVIAREVARDAPGAVRAVVTYGTPAVGGPTYTSAGATYDRGEQERILVTTDELDATRPIAVPVTAILSRHDGIVDWRAQVDVRSASVAHVEVGSTHLGLGFDPDVWLAVADALAPAAAGQRGDGS